MTEQRTYETVKTPDNHHLILKLTAHTFVTAQLFFNCYMRPVTFTVWHVNAPLSFRCVALSPEYGEQGQNFAFCVTDLQFKITILIT